jgi:hypothetical protein
MPVEAEDFEPPEFLFWAVPAKTDPPASANTITADKIIFFIIFLQNNSELAESMTGQAAYPINHAGIALSKGRAFKESDQAARLTIESTQLNHPRRGPGDYEKRCSDVAVLL